MFKVGNRGFNDRYIRLRSHRISIQSCGVGIASVLFDHVLESTS